MKRLLYLMRKFQTFHRYNVCSDVLFSILLIKNVKFAFEIFNNKSPYHAYFPQSKRFIALNFGLFIFKTDNFQYLTQSFVFF